MSKVPVVFFTGPSLVRPRSSRPSNVYYRVGRMPNLFFSLRDLGLSLP